VQKKEDEVEEKTYTKNYKQTKKEKKITKTFYFLCFCFTNIPCRMHALIPNSLKKKRNFLFEKCNILFCFTFYFHEFFLYCLISSFIQYT